MQTRVVFVLILTLTAASCSGDPVNDSSEVSNAGPGKQEYDFGRVRGNAIGLDGTRPDGGVFYADGRTVHVHFPGGPIGNIEEDDCVSQYDMVAQETPDDVQVTVYWVNPKTPPPETGCDAAQWFVVLSIDLDEPLGDRTLSTGSHVVNPAFIEGRLEPTWIPDGWTERESYWDPVRGGGINYGQVSVTIQALADKPGSDIVRGNRHHVDVNIRGVDDGAVVTRESTGVHRLGFEEAGWFYDFLAPPNVDRDTLIEFAQGFDVPATNDGAEE
jgi:hypothetical protein